MILSLQILTNVNLQRPTIAMQTRCVQIQKAHLSVAAGKGTKGMDKSVEVNVCNQGSVVRQPINANPRLKVNRGFHLAP